MKGRHLLRVCEGTNDSQVGVVVPLVDEAAHVGALIEIDKCAGDGAYRNVEACCRNGEVLAKPVGFLMVPTKATQRHSGDGGNGKRGKDGDDVCRDACGVVDNACTSTSQRRWGLARAPGVLRT